ncbi:Hexaprenyldihydroxybenzoate methyltransferase, mitochondrial [Batrachochytrium dendrobatidis]|nr:Hexaprenyldihydroxybenzoate methyltransferase, mitochondrial [Batrachochytrium dendrobatidis]
MPLLYVTTPFSRPFLSSGIKSLCGITSLRTTKSFMHTQPTPSSASVNTDEINKFNRTAAEWWDPNGQYKLLHKMNPVRVKYVRDMLVAHNAVTSESTLALPFAGMRLLDIGCGGGFLSEALARLGAQVVGADASGENINVATAHYALDRLLKKGPGSIDYRHTTAEKLAQQGEQFDAVVALEILEHVNDPKSFVRTCTQLVKPDGLMFYSTINRTPASYIFTILLAEHFLKWVPVGTHSHDKYIAPEELEMYLRAAQSSMLNTSGIGYNLLTKTWSLLDETRPCGLDMNYIMAARKSIL